MKKVQGWFNPEASRIFKSFKSGREMILDQAEIAMISIQELDGEVILIKSLRK
jgi:hypothetical protein